MPLSSTVPQPLLLLMMMCAIAWACSVVPYASAVFAPADSSAFVTGKSSCLSESSNGNCPSFATTNGVIGSWDVTRVESMYRSELK